MSTLKASLKLLTPAQQMAYKCKTGRPFIAVTMRVVDDVSDISGVADPAGRPFQPHQVARLHCMPKRHGLKMITAYSIARVSSFESMTAPM